MTKLGRPFAYVLCILPLFYACDRGIPVPVEATDAVVFSDSGIAQIADQAVVVDASLDAATDANDVTLATDVQMDISLPPDTGVPDYVESLEPNVEPLPGHLFVTGQGDAFDLFWWRGGRFWRRSLTARLAPSLDDEALMETELLLAQSDHLSNVPPFTGEATVLRPPGYPTQEPGHLVAKSENGWTLYNLKVPNENRILPFGDEAVRVGDRSFGPTYPSQSVILGAVDDRTHCLSTTALDGARPVGERNAPLPVAVSSVGHLWMLAYEDGHCAIYTGHQGLDAESGNWRCFADSTTQLLGREGFLSETRGPILVRHSFNTLHLWDARPGVVLDPDLVTMPEPDAMTESLSDNLPPGWRVYDTLGNQILSVGQGNFNFQGRFGESLVYTVSEMDAVEYWVLVNRESLVIVEKAPSARIAFLALGQSPVHVLWDPINAQFDAVALSRYVDVPVLSVRTPSCASRSVETCGLADGDCDGYPEGGLCCPFSYAHSDVSTLNEAEPLSGKWYVSKSDLGVLLGAERSGRIEFKHLSNESEICFACANNLSNMKFFTHTDAVVAAVAQRSNSEASCPSSCSVVLTPPAQTTSDLADMGAEATATSTDDTAVETNSDENEVTNELVQTDEDLLLLHTRPGELVFVDPGCEVLLLDSVATDGGVRILAVCATQVLEYLVENGVLQEEPLRTPMEDGLRWVGPQTRTQNSAGGAVVDFVTAHGADFVLHKWRYSDLGLVEQAIPSALLSLPLDRKTLPFRLPISVHGLTTRIAAEGTQLEFLKDGEWIMIPSHLWAQSVEFSKYEDLAITTAALKDPDAPGFDAIEQTLAVYAHDLSGIDSPWGQRLELESNPILGYSFQGVVLPEWSHYTLEPNIWWAIGRDNVAPTIKRLGLSCESTPRLAIQADYGR